MFHIASHEWIRVLFENAQAGAGAEIDTLIAIDGAGVICRVFEDASAGCFVFGRLSCWDSLSQVSVLRFRLRVQKAPWRRMKSCAIS